MEYKYLKKFVRDKCIRYILACYATGPHVFRQVCSIILFARLDARTCLSVRRRGPIEPAGPAKTDQLKAGIRRACCDELMKASAKIGLNNLIQRAAGRPITGRRWKLRASARR